MFWLVAVTYLGPYTMYRDVLSNAFSACVYLDTKTASTIATSIVHSKLDDCNSLYHNLLKSQITRLQQIQNSLARAVVKIHGKTATEKRASEKTATEEMATGKLGNRKNRQRKMRG